MLGIKGCVKHLTSKDERMKKYCMTPKLGSVWDRDSGTSVSSTLGMEAKFDQRRGQSMRML